MNNKRYVLFLAFLLLPALLLSACSVAGVSVGQPAAAAPSGSTSAQGDTGAAKVQQVAAVAQVQTTQATSAPLTSNTVLEALQSTLEQIYTQVNPSVVNLTVQGTASTGSGGFQIPSFPSSPSFSTPTQGWASGFVWDTQGDIVTNNHVVKGATSITVAFADNTTVTATVVGTDPNSDLAVIKVDVPADKLHPVQVGDSTQLKVGDLVVAIGNPFGDLGGTMTVGYVSALGRLLPVSSSANASGASYQIPDIIQTDAAINPGNSGGVLLNDLGQLVGVPTEIESSTNSSAGIGFAVPSSIVQKVVPQLISNGKAEHPYIGISVTTLTSDLAKAMGLSDTQQGALVLDVTSGSPADKAGLKGSTQQVQVNGQTAQVGGDVVTAINGQPIKSSDDLISYLSRSTSVGDKITLTILRGGKEQTVDVTLAARPSTVPSTGQSGQTQPGTGSGAWLGIQGMTMTSDIAQAMNLPQDQTGVLVQQVVGGSPADSAGLRGSSKSVTIGGQTVQVGGDVIIRVDRVSVGSLSELQSYLAQANPGDQVTLTVLRDGQQMRIDVTLGTRTSSNQD